MKKAVSLLLCLVLCVTLLPVRAEAGSSNITLSQIESAITYAESYLNTDSSKFYGLCAAFVYHSYHNGAGIANRSYNTATLMGDALIDHPGDTNAPRGAFVFWTVKNEPAGHVALSLGNGKIIHSWGNKPNCVVTGTIAKVTNYYGSGSCRGWGPPISGYKLSTDDSAPVTPTVAKTATYNGHTYERYDSSISWTEAKAFCESQGGHLVTIQDSEENSWITSTLLSGCTKNIYFIGVTDTSGSWNWVTGESFSYCNWDQDRPEPTNDSGEDYGAIMGKQVGNNKVPGEWIDIFNTGDSRYSGYELYNCGFICEYEPKNPVAPSAPSVSVSGQSVTVSWNDVANETGYSVYLIQAPWDWPDVKYSANVGVNVTSYTFTNVAYGDYQAFIVSRPNDDNVESPWTAFTVAIPQYTINYDPNGGSGVPAAQTKAEGEALTLSSTVPTRTGYTFLGWSTSSSATTATYQPGGEYTAEGNATLYAVWKIKTYKISFNANGGTGAPKAQTKTYGKTLTLSSTKPTRSGYTFLGWAASKTATKATYQPGGKFTKNAKTTLYAVWKKAAPSYAASFPDPAFLNYVSENIDTNHDGVLSQAEIDAVCLVDVAGLGIRSLTGIELFPGLLELYCYNNSLTSLDVSKNTNLQWLYCGQNQLTALDVNKNTALIGLGCNDNQLTTLDISKNVNLQDLFCGENNLTKLNVSKNTQLRSLYCERNQLAALNVSKNTALEHLYCHDNKLTTLNVSKHASLTNLICGYNPLTSLDISGCAALKYLDCEMAPMAQLDISGAPQLVNLVNTTAPMYLSFDGGEAVSYGMVEYPDYIQPGEVFLSYDKRTTLINSAAPVVSNGLHQGSDGKYYLYKNGAVDKSFTGLYTNADGTWYIVRGRLADEVSGCLWVDDEYVELYLGQLTTWKKDATVVDPYGDGNWVSMRYGRVDMTYTGIAENENGFWYIKDGTLDLTYTDLVTNDYGTWFIYLGQLADWRTGCDWVNGEYCEFYKGQLTTWKKDATLVNPSGDAKTWVSMRYGRIDMTYTGLAENEYGWWYVKNGKLNFDLTDLVTNDYGTWYVYKGQLVTWKDGIQYVEKRHNSYYIYKGQLADWHTGDIEENGVVYHVVNGLVTGAD